MGLLGLETYCNMQLLKKATALCQTRPDPVAGLSLLPTCNTSLLAMRMTQTQQANQAFKSPQLSPLT